MNFILWTCFWQQPKYRHVKTTVIRDYVTLMVCSPLLKRHVKLCSESVSPNSKSVKYFCPIHQDKATCQLKLKQVSENWRNSQISLKRCRVCERATADVEELSSVSSFEYYGSWFRRIGQGRHDLCSGELTASVPILSFPSISRSLTLAQSTSPLLVIQWLEVIHCVMINPGL